MSGEQDCPTREEDSSHEHARVFSSVLSAYRKTQSLPWLPDRSSIPPKSLVPNFDDEGSVGRIGSAFSRLTQLCGVPYNYAGVVLCGVVWCGWCVVCGVMW